MPKTRTTTQTVFAFDELSNTAKEKAREWWRECEAQDSDTSCTYEDAAQCAAIIGIAIAPRNQRCIGGYSDGKWNPSKVKIDSSPAIWYSGFWSQGDGACFEGTYTYAKGASKKIREHTGNNDSELTRIADELQELQRGNFYRLTASMQHRGHYYHSGCMTVNVDGNSARTKSWASCEETLTQLMRDFADWIYKQLENAYNWRNADEQVEDNIRANEYEFTESGELA